MSGGKKKYNVLSLFANIGVAEAYFEEMGIHVAVANEFVEKRAELYSKIYPKTNMICGDITNSDVFNKIISESKKANVNIVMATPPCQGMSTAGRQEEDDVRNNLVLHAINVVKAIKPEYVFLENVPLFYQTKIYYKNKLMLIPEILNIELSDEYDIVMNVINTEDFAVPQARERAIVLMTQKNKKLKTWIIPEKNKVRVTMEDAIGHLPKLDPFVKDVSAEEMLAMFPLYEKRKQQALKISKWHQPPVHVKRQVVAMMHTPTGCTAFDNKVYFPVKENGKPVTGYKNTYKRQNWNTPAYTVTMDNRKISSQNNVHPGRKEGVDSSGDVIFSDARVLTTYELMKIMSLPDDWPLPENTPEPFLRRVIGEGIPPLFLKQVFCQILA